MMNTVNAINTIDARKELNMKRINVAKLISRINIISTLIKIYKVNSRS